MTELDQVWSRMIGEAAANANNDGRQAVADYLRLKATNDALRIVGVRWLFDTFIEIAGEAVRRNAAITIEREDPHNFSYGSSNMVGSLLSIRYGVRCLSVEAGWTRTPRDGVMLNGALAVTRIAHFGIPNAADEYRLVHADTFPKWLANGSVAVESSELRRHFDLLVGS